MNLEPKQKKMIGLFLSFDFMCTMIWLYLRSLPQDLWGARVCEAVNMTFRPTVVNGIGIVGILGWCFFLFYLGQIWLRRR